MRHSFLTILRTALPGGTRAGAGIFRTIFLCAFVAFFTLRSAGQPAPGTNTAPQFNVQAYWVEGNLPVPPETFAPLFTNYTGTNVALDKIVKAATALQADLRKRGQPGASIAVPLPQITNGVVTLRVFQGAYPQILVSGKRYDISPGGALVVWNAAGAPVTNQIPKPTDTNVVHFVLTGFEVVGNSLLSDDTLQDVLVKHTATNAGLTNIQDAIKELQLAYRDRGYVTVGVGFAAGQPPLNATNAIVKLQVTEGVLAEINVTGNHYFSSNNVMAALPSLHTNMILNDQLFQAELNRANANQDRQITPVLADGIEPGTTQLNLEVHDRLPLHAKTELNNQSSPGTPELRLNSSAVYNNLWQLNHSLGVQYSFSPTDYKDGAGTTNHWNFYDLPLVANYSAFYRLPLGNAKSIENAVAASPGSFGYDEATHRFNLPTPSGTPELNFYASRSTIDTGVEFGTTTSIVQSTNQFDPSIQRRDDHQDITINNGLGFRLSIPVRQMAGINSTVSAGLDYKTYQNTSFATNNFIFTQPIIDGSGTVIGTTNFTTASPVPPTPTFVAYLPATIRWDASRNDATGRFDFGFGYSPNVLNVLFSNSRKNFETVAGSSHATGHYHILTGSLTREQDLFGNWKLAVRADGQWANQPLISNEQFGVGGVNGVRGYREGEVFGDEGWRVTSELKTPVHVVGVVNGNQHFTLSGSVFMDYADTFLLDPNGRPSHTPLWGTGCGVVGDIGSTWEARLLFAWPLLNTDTSEAGQIRISFGLSAQF